MRPYATAPEDPFAYYFGALAAIPVSYPGPPYYLLAFTLLVICGLTLLIRMTIRLNRIALYAAVAGIVMCVVASLSSLLSPYHNLLDPARIVTTSIFYLFFICGLALSDYARFFKGFVDTMAVQAALVICAAVLYLPWSEGALVFSVPEFRLWGAGIFPDWPNFYAAMLCMAFIAAVTLEQRWGLGFCAWQPPC
ncbi:hypothetical protein KQX62_04030 [Rhodopseudomonas palustris]|uniref:Uncharacterized protein n=1 Tax=Rhodopseudomonas palustris TaxID=1076 RepID=A0AAX3E1W0_RHOPL|nr:hypothetical protein [Rhodopseudomonas palustris]UYO40491.1 hypothetical protein KQX62_04030 [Rhodopseudomonas palustris]